MGRCTMVAALCALACGHYEATATVTVAVSGPGAVRAPQLQGDCRASCWFSVVREVPVHLEPVVDPHAVFMGWTGACKGTGACDLKPGFDVSVAATFMPATPRRLQVSLNGGGEVRSDPPGIDCPRTCSAEFPEGTSVDLQASPASGWDFSGFAGACAGPRCTIELLADTVAAASFRQLPVTVSVRVSGSGSVVSTPAAIDCPRICSATFAPDAMVTLGASPAPGFSFAAFSGDCAGTSCSLRLTGPAKVSALFSAVPVFKVALVLAGDGLGRVTSTPAGIDCPGACSALFPQGTALVLSAAPDALSKFRQYDGTCAGAQCAFGVNADAAIVARFDQRRYLAVDLGVPAGGYYSSGPAISPRKTLIAGAWGGVQQVFFWDGAMHDTGIGQANAAAVNDAGVVVGNWPAGAAWNGFRWQAGTATDLGTLGGNGSYAAAINADGTIAGWAINSEGVMRAATWTSKGIADLGSLVSGPSGCSAAWGINSAGIAVGYSCTVSAGVRAARFRSGAVDDLGSFGGFTQARAINDKDQIVGFSYLPNGVSHAFLITDGRMLDAGTLPGKKNSDLWAINNSGIAVGYASDDSAQRGVVFGGGRMVDLNSITENAPYAITYASGIDEAGNIAVQSFNGSTWRALLLRPQ